MFINFIPYHLTWLTFSSSCTKENISSECSFTYRDIIYVHTQGRNNAMKSLSEKRFWNWWATFSQFWKISNTHLLIKDCNFSSWKVHPSIYLVNWDESFASNQYQKFCTNMTYINSKKPYCHTAAILLLSGSISYSKSLGYKTSDIHWHSVLLEALR